jgi:hypothetical protein
MVCSQQLSEARAQSNSQAACHDLLDGYHAGGFCGGSGPMQIHPDAGGLPDAGGADASGAVPPICTRNIDCVSTVDPGALPAALQAYGPSGTCWTSTPSVASACATACANQIASLHSLNPTACPLCATNADCAGNAAGAACDPSLGACVACVVDGDCAGNPAGPACDTATNTCVPCTTDAHCTSAGAPHCDPAAHACVGCTSPSQCSSNVCYQQACCTPKACDPAQYECGTVDDGCGGRAPCGTCTLGTCGDFNKCTTVGVACTPGAAGVSAQCVASERCIADAWHQDYRCSPTDLLGSSCMIYPMDSCENAYTASDNTPVDTFTCVSGCRQNCITQTDCPAGTTCTPWSAVPGMPQPITPSLPGQCL